MFTYQATNNVADAHNALLGSGQAYHGKTISSEEFVTMVVYMKSQNMPLIHHIEFTAKNVKSVEYVFAIDNEIQHTQTAHHIGTDNHAIISDSYSAGVYANSLYIKAKPIAGHDLTIEIFNLELEACMAPGKESLTVFSYILIFKTYYLNSLHIINIQ